MDFKYSGIFEIRPKFVMILYIYCKNAKIAVIYNEQKSLLAHFKSSLLLKIIYKCTKHYN